VIRDVATSGFDLYARQDGWVPDLVLRWRPPTRTHAAALVLRRRARLLASAVLLVAVNSQIGDVGYTVVVEEMFYIFFVLCLMTLLAGYRHEKLRDAGRKRVDRFAGRRRARGRSRGTCPPSAWSHSDRDGAEPVLEHGFYERQVGRRPFVPHSDSGGPVHAGVRWVGS
jgi:hypothetical protein